MLLSSGRDLSLAIRVATICFAGALDFGASFRGTSKTECVGLRDEGSEVWQTRSEHSFSTPHQGGRYEVWAAFDM